MSLVPVAGVLLLVALFAPPALSQDTTAQCTLATFHWTFNSHNQSPCAVASSLLGVCSPNYQLQVVHQGQHYDGPTVDGQNPCQCSTVSYSMVSACAACQNATISQWSEWSANCADVSISTFADPIPNGIFVPGWAYLDVKSGDSFNITLANLNVNKTESMAIPLPTAAPLPPIPSQNVSTGISSSDNNIDVNTKKANSIIGTIVGVTFGFAALSIFVLYCQIRKTEKARKWEKEDALAMNSPTKNTSPSTLDSEQKVLPTLVVHPPTVGSLPTTA